MPDPSQTETGSEIIMGIQITRTAPAPAPRGIDYARMQKVWPQQKAALTRAVKTGSAAKVAQVCIAAVKVWDEIGAWPDDWALFQRALDGALPWRQQQNFNDVVYGRVVITETDEDDD